MTHRPLVILPTLFLALAGCPGPEPTVGCDEFDEVFAWQDADGDGYGAHVPVGWKCVLGANESSNDGDCDDTRADVLPGGEEGCDLTDNDCDGFVDEETPGVPWYPDEDGDTWGDAFAMLVACEQPGAQYTRTAGDCDDSLVEVNPAAAEICNDGVDDDCDGFADDADAGVDPNTFTRWHRDADEDGYGDPFAFLAKCAQPARSLADGTDCDDSDPDINPDASEICNPGEPAPIDEDCDGVSDDDDPSVDPAGFTEVIADRDHDNFGSQTETMQGCSNPPRNNRLDCDDNDPLATIEQDWYRDDDGDLAGTGDAVVTQCLNPGGGLAPELYGEDCAPNNPNVFPRQAEDCFDGTDNNCDQLADCADPDCSTVPSCVPPCADDVWMPGSLPSSQRGNTSGAGNDLATICGGGGAAEEYAWWFTPPQSGTIVFDAQGSAYDTVLFAQEDCGMPTLVCNDDYYNLASRIEVRATAGVPFLVVIDGYSIATGSFVVNAHW